MADGPKKRRYRDPVLGIRVSPQAANKLMLGDLAGWATPRSPGAVADPPCSVSAMIVLNPISLTTLAERRTAPAQALSMVLPRGAL